MLILFALASATALAEDLRTTDGAVYRHMKVVQVDADGVVVEHDKGLAKIDFHLLPPEVRQRYNFNERKAAIFHTQEKQRAQQMMQENQRIVKEHEQRELARIQKLMESSESGDEVTYGRAKGAASEARLTAQIHQHVDAREDAALAAARQPRTFWNAPFWQSPIVQLLGGILGGGGGGGGREGPMGNGAGWDNHHDFDH